MVTEVVIEKVRVRSKSVFLRIEKVRVRSESDGNNIDE